MNLLALIIVICFIAAIIFSIAIIGDITATQAPPALKIAAFGVDVIHVFVSLLPPFIIATILFDIIINKKFDVRKVLFIDVFYLSMVTGILFYGMCPLTIMYNKILGIHDCVPFFSNWRKRFDSNARHSTNDHFTRDNPNCEKNTRAWMKGQTYSILVVLTINILFFIHFIQ